MKWDQSACWAFGDDVEALLGGGVLSIAVGDGHKGSG